MNIIPETVMADPQTIEVTARELPALRPPVGIAAWERHPRVHPDVLPAGEALCPYCSAHHVFKGEAPESH